MIEANVSPYVFCGLREKYLKQSFFRKSTRTKDYVINIILEYRNQKREDVFTTKRNAPLVYTRQLIALLLKQELRLPLQDIANELNMCNHTSIIHALRRIKDLRDTEEKVRQDIANIKYLL